MSLKYSYFDGLLNLSRSLLQSALQSTRRYENEHGLVALKMNEK